jgi:hypothetical protein
MSQNFITYRINCALTYFLSPVYDNTGCSKNHATHGLLGICVSWTPHFKEIVAYTISGLKRPPDFFLWGHLKDTVYSNHPHTLQELQANIQLTDINWHIAKRVR